MCIASHDMDLMETLENRYEDCKCYCVDINFILCQEMDTVRIQDRRRLVYLVVRKLFAKITTEWISWGSAAQSRLLYIMLPWKLELSKDRKYCIVYVSSGDIQWWKQMEGLWKQKKHSENTALQTQTAMTMHSVKI